jgi:7,8-didemethyl-8-hydroxy-5-deazariboflavin synthase CofH subunit
MKKLVEATAPAEDSWGTMHDISWANQQTLQNASWDGVQQRVALPVRTALDKVLSSLDGSVLSREECLTLANCSGDDLFGLVAAANELRRQLVGDVVSYVVTRNINFTNVCFVGCKFCAFSVGPRDETAYFLSLDQMGEKCREAEQWGATEVCIQGGLPRNLPPFYYRDILRAVKSATPNMHAHAFSPMEMVYGVELTRMPLREYLVMLKDNGLDTLPGTAAEILDDSVRHVLSANKLSTAQWCEVIETAHQCGIRSTSTMMYGHAETHEHWVNQLLLLRQIQSRTGGFTEFVPLGFIHDNTLLFAQGLSRAGATLEEHLRVHALARVMLAGCINHIQVSWVKLGRQVSQLTMLAGADDYGGTLFEENISRLAGATAGQYISTAEFQERILELGRVPAQRNTVYSKYVYPVGNPAEGAPGRGCELRH